MTHSGHNGVPSGRCDVRLWIPDSSELEEWASAAACVCSLPIMEDSMFELSRCETIRRAGMSKVIAVLLASVCAASSPFAQKYEADVPHSTDRHTEIR